jgi:hypothetical protein
MDLTGEIAGIMARSEGESLILVGPFEGRVAMNAFKSGESPGVATEKEGESLG